MKKKVIIFIIVIVVLWLAAYAYYLIRLAASKRSEEGEAGESTTTSSSTTGSTSSTTSNSSSSSKANSPFKYGSDTRSRSDNPVLQLQRACNYFLKKAGKPTITTDGIWGKNTEAAVENLRAITVQPYSQHALAVYTKPFELWILGNAGSRYLYFKQLNALITYTNNFENSRGKVVA